MSWADDIRCLYCDGRLPLYRKITNGQFCNSAHRKAYWQEQERLAVERLHQTHDSLRAYRPANGSIETILGQPEAPEQGERPRWLTLANTGKVPVIGFIPDPTPLHVRWLPENLGESNPVPAAGAPSLRWPVYIYDARDLNFESAGPLPLPLSERDSKILSRGVVESIALAVDPVYTLALDFALDGGAIEELIDLVEENIPPVAGLLALLLPSERPVQVSLLRTDSSPLAIQLRMRLPLDPAATLDIHGTLDSAGRAAMPTNCAVDAANAAFDTACAIEFRRMGMRMPLDLASVSEIRGVPACGGPLPLAANRLIDSTSARFELTQALDLHEMRMQMPPGRASVLEIHGAPAFAGPLTLAVNRLIDSAAAASDTTRALDFRKEAAPPELSMSTPPMRPRLRLAAGSRYAVRVHQPASHSMEPAAYPATASTISLPERSAKINSAKTAKQAAAPAPVQEPNAAGLVKLPRTSQPVATGSLLMRTSKTWTAAQPACTDPMRPSIRFQPVQETPGPMVAPDFAVSMPPYAPLEAPAEQPRAHVWTHAIDFWNRAPRDLKLLAVAIPILLGLALHPALPKVRVSAPADTAGMQHSFEQAMNTQWTSVRKSLVERAAVALDEDFRTGLDDWASRWTSRGEANAEWSFDATGFVRPGPLALYKPTVALTDYQMQFLGMIDKKAMSWVVRAVDFDNFYVVKLVVLKPGPLPTIGVTRYAVVNGKADSRVDTVVPIDARADTLYRVMMDIHGDDFSLTVQGQMIDAWSEPRLKHGGVGFFSGRGEDSRVRWVQVTHQYDMLGRLCAYLAPYNLPSSSGNLQP